MNGSGAGGDRGAVPHMLAGANARDGDADETPCDRRSIRMNRRSFDHARVFGAMQRPISPSHAHLRCGVRFDRSAARSAPLKTVRCGRRIALKRRIIYLAALFFHSIHDMALDSDSPMESHAAKDTFCMDWENRTHHAASVRDVRSVDLDRRSAIREECAHCR